MDVLSICPLPVAPLVWEITPGRWVLTVVAKATFALAPAAVSLAAEQEPIHEEDQHWDDDPNRSVYAPADLVPFKPRPEVVLVGSVFAKNGQPVRSLVARIHVGSVDKSIQVVCPSVRTQNGEVREGKRFSKMPLSYERAAGGPGTPNPAGLGPQSPRDPYGQLQLPCLLPIGADPSAPSPPTVGFGPIAASWPARAKKIGRGREDRDARRAPFGEGFDAAFLQCAPPDQLLTSLSEVERISLENLHPQHATLVTTLPGLTPRGRVEMSNRPREVAFSPDTLWIDTDRSLCTVTYRLKIDLEHEDQEGRVLVGLPKGTEPIAWAKLAPAPPAPSSPVGSRPPPGKVVVPSAPLPPAARPSRPASASPGLASPGPSVALPPPPAAPQAPPPPPPPPVKVPVSAQTKLPVSGRGEPPEDEIELVDEPSSSEIDIETTYSEHRGSGPWGGGARLDQTAQAQPITEILAQGPETSALPFQPAPPGWRPPAAIASDPGRNPRSSPSTSSTSGERGPLRTLPDWFPSKEMPAFATNDDDAKARGFGSSPGIHAAEDPQTLPPIPPQLPTAPWAPVAPPPLFGAVSPSGRSEAPEDAFAQEIKALSTPGAPALYGAPAPSPSEAKLPVSGAQDAGSRPGAEPGIAERGVVIELVWFDPALAPVFGLGSAEEKHGTEQAPSKDANAAAGGGEKGEKGEKKEAQSAPMTEAERAELLRRRAHTLLSTGTPLQPSALEGVLYAAEEAEIPAPAYALTTGTLEVCLDEVEMLKALVAAAAPLAATDKKLKEAVDVASEMLKAPMQGMPDFAQGLGARLRDAWNKANRALPADHLTTCTERLLLEQRAYQKRDLLDDTWIRALLAGAGPEIPVYLPARISKKLPLFRRFPARLFAEVVWQQDQYETCPIALRAWAVGRLPPKARARRR